MRRLVAAGMLLAAVLGVGGAAGQTVQAPPSCADEVRQLRFLVQKYGSERTALEFALAKAEATRQALQAELDRLKVDDKGR